MNKMKLLARTLTGIMLMGLGQSVLAHTRLDVPTQTEGTRTINNIVIGHSCSDTVRVIGTSVVFPNGLDSAILVDGQPHGGPLTDFLTNYGNNFQLLWNRGAFDAMAEKKESNGSVVGFWVGGGPGMPSDLNVATPVRLTAAGIEPTSCATSVKISVSIANICEITGVGDFNSRDGVVDLWTHNNLGTPYDRVSTTDDGPASFTITRDLVTNPLPSSCGGTGVTVEVKPSAAQINRDMPVVIDGQQIWPLP